MVAYLLDGDFEWPDSNFSFASEEGALQKYLWSRARGVPLLDQFAMFVDVQAAISLHPG